MKAKFGLDFGNSRCKISYSFIKDGNPVVRKLNVYNDSLGVLTIAYYDEDDDKWIFGEDAIKSANDTKKPFINVHDILDNCTLDSFKGNEFYNSTCNYQFKSKSFTQEDVLKDFFSYLFNGINEEISKINDVTFEKVITLTYHVSATNDTKILLKNLVEANGFTVFKMCCEPIAAALSVFHEFNNRNIDEILVIDIGANSTDFAILNVANNSLDTINVDSIITAGNNFDKDIYDYAYTKVSNYTKGEELTNFQQFNLNLMCREAKHFLSENDFSIIEYEAFVRINLPFDYQMYKQAISNSVNKIVDFIINECSKKYKFQAVLITGGSALSRHLMDTLKDKLLFQNRALFFLNSYDPIFQTSFGASILSLDVYKLNTISPKSYGVLILNAYNQKVLSLLILKNTKLPYRFRKEFKTSNVGQTRAFIEVAETNETKNFVPASRYNIIGSKLLTLKRSSMYKCEPIYIDFYIDVDGLATVKVSSNYNDTSEISFSSNK